jgi:hypothetical protein
VIKGYSGGISSSSGNSLASATGNNNNNNNNNNNSSTTKKESQMKPAAVEDPHLKILSKTDFKAIKRYNDKYGKKDDEL